MRKIETTRNAKIIILTLVIVFIIGSVGCASGGGDKEPTVAPDLGRPDEVQTRINGLPAIPMSGKTIKFKFGGEFWNGDVDGAPFFGGKYTSEEKDGKLILTLVQTHMWVAKINPVSKKPVGWTKASGPTIYLAYTDGPVPLLVPTTKD